jgi:hypothetical protein
LEKDFLVTIALQSTPKVSFAAQPKADLSFSPFFALLLFREEEKLTEIWNRQLHLLQEE